MSRVGHFLLQDLPSEFVHVDSVTKTMNGNLINRVQRRVFASWWIEKEVFFFVISIPPRLQRRTAPVRTWNRWTAPCPAPTPTGTLTSRRRPPLDPTPRPSRPPAAPLTSSERIRQHGKKKLLKNMVSAFYYEHRLSRVSQSGGKLPPDNEIDQLRG